MKGYSRWNWKTAAIALLIGLVTLAAPCLAVADDQTNAEQEFRASVSRYLSAVVTEGLGEQERIALAGSEATVIVNYGKDGRFERSSVTAAGRTPLAVTLHRKVNWKAFPTPPTQRLAGQATQLSIGISDKGAVEVLVRLI